MPYMNHCIFMGHVSFDMELKRTQGGTAFVNNTIGILRQQPKKEDETKPEPIWDNVEFTVWGKRAETIAQYFKKSDPIILLGELRTQRWEDKETGGKRQKNGLHVNAFKFAGGKSDGEKTPKYEKADTSPANKESHIDYEEVEDFDPEMMPF